MLDEGYAAVSYRNVAKAAGVAPALVQYYFPALDDLFGALVRARTEQSLTKLTKAFATRPPLRVIFDFARDPRGAAITAEFMALANHRKAIRSELRESGEQVRRLALAVLAERADDYRFAGEPLTAEVAVFMMTALPRMIVMERATGMKTSLSETTEFLKRFLDRVEPP